MKSCVDYVVSYFQVMRFASLSISEMFFTCDVLRRTSLHVAVINNNSEAFSLLLTAGGLNLELKDCNGHTVLWLALSSETFDLDDGDSYARRLIAHGSSPNTIVSDNG